MERTELQIEEGVFLAPYTTFRIGGPARFFCTVRTEEELVAAVDFARERGRAMFVLGGGSNLLVSDGGFDGLVIHVGLDGEFEPVADGGLVRYCVPAGVDWDEFVRRVCERGLSGVECLAGIPGLVGGTPVQNVGAYGQEVAETISSVRVLDLETMEFLELSREQCGFAYRTSIFNSSARGRYVVTAVRFCFDAAAKAELKYADLQRYFAGRAGAPTPIEVYGAVRKIRNGKGMLIVEGEADCRSAGSFFKNPVVSEAVLEVVAAALGGTAVPHWAAGEGMVKLPAAWLLDQAGFHKGFAMGAAGISSRHTLALINRGGARFADVVALRDAIQGEVLRRFGILLEQEPVVLGV